MIELGTWNVGLHCNSGVKALEPEVTPLKCKNGNGVVDFCTPLPPVSRCSLEVHQSFDPTNIDMWLKAFLVISRCG